LIRPVYIIDMLFRIALKILIFIFVWMGTFYLYSLCWMIDRTPDHYLYNSDFVYWLAGVLFLAFLVEPFLFIILIINTINKNKHSVKQL